MARTTVALWLTALLVLVMALTLMKTRQPVAARQADATKHEEPLTPGYTYICKSGCFSSKKLT